MPMDIRPVTLEGRYVRLVPISLEYLDGLWEIGREPSIWAWTAFALRSREEVKAHLLCELEKAERKESLTFVQIALASGEIAGSTRFMAIDGFHRRLEIGGTWLHPRWQRSPLNTEAKLLLLRHAFETWGCLRVEFKTHSKNQKSLQALRRIGAIEEGTFRKHMIQPDGSSRHSVFFSIIDEEWPSVKAGLEQRLAHPPLSAGV